MMIHSRASRQRQRNAVATATSASAPTCNGHHTAVTLGNTSETMSLRGKPPLRKSYDTAARVLLAANNAAGMRPGAINPRAAIPVTPPRRASPRQDKPASRDHATNAKIDTYAAYRKSWALPPRKLIAAAPAVIFAFYKIFGLDANSSVGVGNF